MSAAAARRRKQLASRKDTDNVEKQLVALLEPESIDEATAYEALQLAQSIVRKRVKAGNFESAGDLAYETALKILNKNRVSVASQMMTLLVEVLRETHTEESDMWLSRIEELQAAHDAAMKAVELPAQETLRLHRLQRDWLRQCALWSSELGPLKYGSNRLQKLLGFKCWSLSSIAKAGGVPAPVKGGGLVDDDEEYEEIMELQCDAMQHMALAEEPQQVVDWLATLPDPTDEETKFGHTCPPALREALLTRTLLLLCAVENLRDANKLLRAYIDQVEKRDMTELAASYTKKDDGKAPSHTIFCCMLLRVCEKDTRTGPLFSWLLRSFKRELDGLYKAPVVAGYTSKIGKVYFNIQPPPSMLSMVENMMGMMGGGGAPGGINPAMMQALAAQMQQGGMM